MLVKGWLAILTTQAVVDWWLTRGPGSKRFQTTSSQVPNHRPNLSRILMLRPQNQSNPEWKAMNPLSRNALCHIVSILDIHIFYAVNWSSLNAITSILKILVFAPSAIPNTIGCSSHKPVHPTYRCPGENHCSSHVEAWKSHSALRSCPRGARRGIGINILFFAWIRLIEGEDL